MNRNWGIALTVAGLAIAAWYYYHKNCPVCQEKWNLWKNRIGSALIESKKQKPEGGA